MRYITDLYTAASIKRMRDNDAEFMASIQKRDEAKIEMRVCWFHCSEHKDCRFYLPMLRTGFMAGHSIRGAGMHVRTLSGIHPVSYENKTK